MCVNAEKTAYDLLLAAEPSFKALLQVTDQTNTTVGLAAVAAYDTALSTLQNWQSGTTSQNVIEVINALQAAFNAVLAALPANTIDADLQLLINVVIGGIVTVIGIVTGNSPNPNPVPAGVTAEAAQKLYEHEVMATTAAQVQALVPDFKVSVWRSIVPGFSPADQYKRAWNAAVKKGGFPKAMEL